MKGALKCPQTAANKKVHPAQHPSQQGQHTLEHRKGLRGPAVSAHICVRARRSLNCRRAAGCSSGREGAAMRKMIGLLLALALQAALLQTSHAVGDATATSGAAPSCDITDLDCIAKDFKASLQKKPSTFVDEYQQFAEMIAPVLLLAHGGNFESADKAIADFFVSIENAIFGLADVITGKKQAQVSIAPPSFFNNGAANISTSLTGLSAQAVGINYNPCMISVSPRGLDVTAAGVNIQPNVVEVLGEGLAIWPWAVNIQPALIYVNPWGANISPEGVSVTPALIAVAPIIHAEGKPAVNVQPIGLNVKPPSPPPGGRKMV